tara:strand:+ start:1748 stop:2758 length:1011 start_codon:yes stop_codon:yes gene_type:complete
MRQAWSFSLLLILCGFTTACQKQDVMDRGVSEELSARAIPVIFDTDIGNDIDDTWALLQLICSPELETKLIVTATGDTELRAKVTAKYLQVAGKTDIPIGIGVRGEGGVDNQKPWVEGYELSEYPGPIFEDGIQAMIDVIRASDEIVTLLVVGPATNIKVILERAPEIASKCKFIGMHGSVNVGYDGSTTPSSEYNVRADIPAFQSVLNADWHSLEITPLDSCGDIVLGGERYQKLIQSDDPALVALFENYKIFSELVTWIKVDYFDIKSTTLFDCVAVYMAYSQDHLLYEKIPLVVDDQGMTLHYPGGTNVRVATGWRNQDAFYEHLTQRLLGSE